MGTKQNNSPRVFKTPASYIAGDLFIASVMILFYTLGLTLVLGFFSVIIIDPENTAATFKTCLVFSLAAAIPVRAATLNWQITAAKNLIRTGIPGWSRTIACDRVSLISHGTLSERLYKEKNGSQKPVTSIVLEYHNAGKITIQLNTGDAAACLKLLKGRCRNAAIIDMEGNQHLPKESNQQKKAIKRLNRGILLISR